MSEKILITGGCGFVGANLALQLKADFPAFEIIALDNLKRRGSELNVPRLKEAGITFIHGDIRNKEDFDPVGPVTMVIEAAAEPSVLSGINSAPDYLLNTNLQGAIHCFNYAVKHNAKLIFLSTSRVYPIDTLSQAHYTEQETRFALQQAQKVAGLSQKGVSEDFPLQGARSFYGTSKLSAELLIDEYAAFYGLQATVNRCGVLTGPWQMGKVDQGVVVLWLARHFWQRKLNYIGYGGTGKQVRDLLHVNDLYALVKMQIENFAHFQGRTFNVGGGQGVSLSLLELTGLCQEITGNRIQIDPVPETRTADVPIYITDYTRLQEHCGWQPKWGPKQVLQDIFEWMHSHESMLKTFLY